MSYDQQRNKTSPPQIIGQSQTNFQNVSTIDKSSLGMSVYDPTQFLCFKDKYPEGK